MRETLPLEALQYFLHQSFEHAEAEVRPNGSTFHCQSSPRVIKTLRPSGVIHVHASGTSGAFGDFTKILPDFQSELVQILS